MHDALFYLAPLRGITDRIFRRLYEEHFGRFDYMLAPFVPTVRGRRVRESLIADLQPDAYNDPQRLIPQVIGNDAEGFLLLCNKFAELGFSSVNWNLGCPAPKIAGKKRGAGLLPHRDAILRFLDEVTPRVPLPMSIKARLGYYRNDDLEKLIPVFNCYPLKELIIHPRTGMQLYDGTADADKFEICLWMSKLPTVYNGDIRTVDDFNYLADRFPTVSRWMIGRGVLMNPYLLNELKVEPPPSNIRSFLIDLLDACKDHPNQASVLGRMKEIWRYLSAYYGKSPELETNIMHCKTIGEYWGIVNRYVA